MPRLVSVGTLAESWVDAGAGSVRSVIIALAQRAAVGMLPPDSFRSESGESVDNSWFPRGVLRCRMLGRPPEEWCSAALIDATAVIGLCEAERIRPPVCVLPGTDARERRRAWQRYESVPDTVERIDIACSRDIWKWLGEGEWQLPPDYPYPAEVPAAEDFEDGDVAPSTAEMFGTWLCERFDQANAALDLLDEGHASAVASAASLEPASTGGPERAAIESVSVAALALGLCGYGADRASGEGFESALAAKGLWVRADIPALPVASPLGLAAGGIPATSAAPDPVLPGDSTGGTVTVERHTASDRTIEAALRKILEQSDWERRSCIDAWGQTQAALPSLNVPRRRFRAAWAVVAPGKWREPGRPRKTRPPESNPPSN
jgi:hypothetical protein